MVFAVPEVKTDPFLSRQRTKDRVRRMNTIEGLKFCDRSLQTRFLLNKFYVTRWFKLVLDRRGYWQ